MKLLLTLFSATALVATTIGATANQADRRAAMKEVGAAAKAIRGGGDVAGSAQKLADLAAQIPALFELNEITGDSEALPVIWTDWDGFKAKGVDLQNAGQALGATCGACHKAYRVAK